MNTNPPIASTPLFINANRTMTFRKPELCLLIRAFGYTNEQTHISLTDLDDTELQLFLTKCEIKSTRSKRETFDMFIRENLSGSYTMVEMLDWQLPHVERYMLSNTFLIVIHQSQAKQSIILPNELVSVIVLINGYGKELTELIFASPITKPITVFLPSVDTDEIEDIELYVSSNRACIDEMKRPLLVEERQLLSIRNTYMNPNIKNYFKDCFMTKQRNKNDTPSVVLTKTALSPCDYTNKSLKHIVMRSSSLLVSSKYTTLDISERGRLDLSNANSLGLTEEQKKELEESDDELESDNQNVLSNPSLLSNTSLGNTSLGSTKSIKQLREELQKRRADNRYIVVHGQFRQDPGIIFNPREPLNNLNIVFADMPCDMLPTRDAGIGNGNDKVAKFKVNATQPHLKYLYEGETFGSIVLKEQLSQDKHVLYEQERASLLASVDNYISLVSLKRPLGRFEYMIDYMIDTFNLLDNQYELSSFGELTRQIISSYNKISSEQSKYENKKRAMIVARTDEIIKAGAPSKPYIAENVIYNPRNARLVESSKTTKNTFDFNTAERKWFTLPPGDRYLIKDERYIIITGSNLEQDIRAKTCVGNTHEDDTSKACVGNTHKDDTSKTCVGNTHEDDTSSGYEVVVSNCGAIIAKGSGTVYISGTADTIVADKDVRIVMNNTAKAHFDGEAYLYLESGSIYDMIPNITNDVVVHLDKVGLRRENEKTADALLMEYSEFVPEKSIVRRLFYHSATKQSGVKVHHNYNTAMIQTLIDLS